MASDVLPDPETPTTATVRHSGTSTSILCKLLCRAPRTRITVGRVPGSGRSSGDVPAIGIRRARRRGRVGRLECGREQVACRQAAVGPPWLSDVEDLLLAGQMVALVRAPDCLAQRQVARQDHVFSAEGDE